jgi:hypothetical protein
MKLTKNQLQSIIKEEYLRITPVKRGQVMSEARANYLAEQVLEEGLWDSIKAGWAAFKGAATGGGSKLGDDAAKLLGPVIQQVQAVAQAAAKASADVQGFIGSIKDEAVKKAVEEARKSFEDSLKGSISSALSDGIKNLQSAGMSEEEAKTLASTILSAELANLAGKGGK